MLLFLYLGVIALAQANSDPRAGARAASLLAVAGVINVPIVHYSVVWWNSLHQGATVTKFDSPSIAPEMLWPLLVMALACQLFFFWALLRRSQGLLLLRERRARWVQPLLQAHPQ